MSLDPALLARAIELIELGGPSAKPPTWLAARLSAGIEALASGRGQSARELVDSIASDPALRADLAELLRVGETRFFRDAEQWQALRRELLPNLPTLRALSAGCSTGEEAWTLAMLMDEGAGRKPYRVLGLDRSTAALAAARDGTYAEDSARELPPELKARYLQPQPPDALVIQAGLRSKVSFMTRDLGRDGIPGEFDLIVCKNVLIYLTEEAGQRLLESLRSALSAHGSLLVARSEIPRVRRQGFAPRELAPGVTVFRAG